MTSLLIFIIGLAVGSFLNVVIYRLKTKQSLWWPPSHCPACEKNIKWYDNVPFFSFLCLAGQCRFCRQKISWQYPLIEVTTGLIFWWLFLSFGLSFKFFSLAVFSSFLLVIFVYDLRYTLILDQITVPAAIAALILNLSLGYNLFNLLLGLIIGAGFFAAQFFISSGRWIGDGDIRLGAVMGLMLGWQLVLVALFIAYFVGAIVGLFLVISVRKKMSSEIPFGTFLTIATFLTFLYGQPILNWYLRLSGF